MEENASITQSLRKLWRLLSGRQRRHMGLLFGIMLGGALLEVASLGIVPLFVAALGNPDRVLNQPLLGDWLRRFGVIDPRSLFLFGGTALLLAFALKVVYMGFTYWAQARFLRNQQVRLRTRLFAAYMHAPYLFHLRRNPAELMRNANQEVERVTITMMAPLLGLALHSTLAVAIFIFLLMIQPLVTLVGVGLFTVASYLFLRVVRRRALAHGRMAQDHRGELIKSVNHGLGGIKEVTVLGRQAEFVNSYRLSAVHLADSFAHHQITVRLTPTFLELVAVAGLLGIGLLLLASGSSMTAILPTLALFAAALLRIRQSVAGIAGTWNALRYEHYVVNPVYDDLCELDQVSVPAKDGLPAKRLAFTGQIQIKGLAYRYPDATRLALSDITMTVRHGESVALVGGTGAGKSTLADLILGLLEPEHGSISVDGVDIRTNTRAWQANIGYIPQALYLLDDTLRRNIAFGLPDTDIDDARVQEALRIAQLSEFLNDLPQGLDTYVGDRGVRLSGGQRQRVCIARALYSDPSVLVLDEATSALDNRTEQQIVKELDRTRGERTLIIIAHRLSTVQGCDRLYFLQNGRIEGEGAYQELLQTSPAFRHLANIADAADGSGPAAISL